MKLVQKTFILFVISAICYMSFNYTGNSRMETKMDFHSGSPDQAEHFLCANNSPFQVTLPENEINTVNNVVYRILKSSSFKTAFITIQNKNAIFYTTLRYVTHVKYICNTLKKSELLYPFHFFF